MKKVSNQVSRPLIVPSVVMVREKEEVKLFVSSCLIAETCVSFDTDQHQSTGINGLAYLQAYDI